MNPSHDPSLDQNQFWCIWTKEKKIKNPTPCQIKKIMFFFLRHIMEFCKHLLTKFRPKKRLIILITYYSQYSCKKNQEKNQKNHTVFIATKYNWSRTTTTLQNTYNITYYTICCTYYIHIKEKEKNIYDEIRQKTTTNPTAKTYYTWSPYTRSYTHDVIAYNNVTEKKTKLKLFVFWEKNQKTPLRILAKQRKKQKLIYTKMSFVSLFRVRVTS